MNPNPERPILWLLSAITSISPRTAQRLADWWFAYADRQLRTCGRITRPFWFEITGQGHDARKYERAIRRDQ